MLLKYGLDLFSASCLSATLGTGRAREGEQVGYVRMKACRQAKCDTPGRIFPPIHECMNDAKSDWVPDSENASNST